MNLEKYNSLPDHLRKVIMDSIIQYERDYPDVYKEDRARLIKKGQEAGVIFYTLESSVAKWFLDTAYNAAWDYQMERFPKETPKLRELLSKK